MNTDHMSDRAGIGVATYSPEDNKLRLYPLTRLDKELYERLSAMGFSWAPKQELFVAPKWTPERYDLLLELCGDVGDEDTSLADRADRRAERFQEYSEKRGREAQVARDRVDRICDGIPFGQPILVGHHSERRARKDAARIDSGIRDAVRLWETSSYWTSRAEGALRHAKYKQRPDVRARRIRTLEAEKRRYERAVLDATTFLAAWRMEDLDTAKAVQIANYDHISRRFPLAEYPRPQGASEYEGAMSLWSALKDGIISALQAAQIATEAHERTIARSRRYVEHYEHRIAYERALLMEQGGLAAERLALEVGGQVLIGGTWFTIRRVNKRGGAVVSVTTDARYGRVRDIAEVTEYKPPSEEHERGSKLAPLVNYPGDGFLEMSMAEWKKCPRDYVSTRLIPSTSTSGAHRARFKMVSGERGVQLSQVFITDAKRSEPPPATRHAVAP